MKITDVRVTIFHHPMPPLHASLAIPNCDWYEVLVPEDRYDFGLASYPNPGPDRMMHAPTAPGLGIEIAWEWTRAHEVPL